jgi:hypothetical protein
MKLVHLLLGNSDRRTNTIIEVAVRDVCYNHAVVECFRTSRVDELLRLGRSDMFDLMVVAPGNLMPEPSRPSGSVSMTEALRLIQSVRTRRSTQIIAVGVEEEHRLMVLEAGAENAFGLFLDTEAFKAEVRRVLRIPEQAEEPAAPARSSFMETLLRSFSFGSKSN